MAISQAEVRFLSQNFPGAGAVPVQQIRDLASQVGMDISSDLNALLNESGGEITLSRIQQAEPTADIDLSDIPLDLSQQSPSPQAPSSQPAPEGATAFADPALAQYDDMLGAGQMEAAGDYDSGIDFGLQQPPEFTPEPPAPEASNGLNGSASIYTPAGDYSSFADYDAGQDVESLDVNDSFGTPAVLGAYMREHVASGKMKFEYVGTETHLFLKEDQMRERLAEEQRRRGVLVDAYDLPKSKITNLRFMGKGFARTASLARELTPDLHVSTKLNEAEYMFSNPKDDTVYDPRKEEQTMAQAHPTTEPKPEGQASENEVVAPEADSPRRSIHEAIESLEGFADNGDVSYDALEAVFDEYGIPEDDPVYDKVIKAKAADGRATIRLDDVKAFLTAKPAPKEPSSQPSQSQNPKETEKDADLENENQTKKNDPPDGPANKGNNNDVTEIQSNPVGAGFHFLGAGAGKLSRGLEGAAKGTWRGAVGGMKNAHGFLQQSQQKKREFSQGVESSLNYMSNQLDSIAQDRSAMKSASNMFERKQVADRMGQKMDSLAKFSTGFADTLGSKQGAKALRSGNMSHRLEALEEKFNSVFDEMEPGKGEKKAFDNIKASVEAAMKAVRAVFQAIANVFSAKGPDGPGAAPSMSGGPR